MEEYYQAKAKLFLELLARSCKFPKKAFVNADDEYGQRLLKVLGGRGIPAESLSVEGIGSCCAENITLSTEGAEFDLVCADESVHIKSPLLGLINVQNLMTAVRLLRALDFSYGDILSVICKASVPGRLQKITAPNGAVFLVDYAHTPDALQKALSVVDTFIGGGSRSIVVFGAGGDRDKGKRPLMAKACIDADIVIVTSDNPRTEDPDLIIKDVLEGFSDMSNVYHDADRKKAIQKAYSLSSAGDVILVAGKGHEDYQIIQKTKYKFSDFDEIQSLFEDA